MSRSNIFNQTFAMDLVTENLYEKGKIVCDTASVLVFYVHNISVGSFNGETF